ncbi:hydrogenase expression/formation protein [Neotabrizicola sp. VNH66]|uniref:hydrogenase expression/formation protein n=1 Tax=Neotabrizicola sp. VNH66 TaxID=3400918 RepID=UPI003C09D08F
MVQNFHLPPTGFGPGSQADEAEDFDYMALPSGMRTYSAHMPEVEDATPLAPALALLAEIAAAAEVVAQGMPPQSFDLSGLDAANRALMAETLGQGEVSVRARGVPAVAMQESVFAGVWVLKAEGIDRVEVGPVPGLARTRAFLPVRPAIGALARRAPGVVNAPALLAELMDKSMQWQGPQDLHVVNLTLLPHTEEDLVWLAEALGEGSVTILSRGYGNCRVSATAQANVWRVQFFNSMDTLILDTFEVTDMPEVALAAPEDLTDSAERIREVLEAIR